mmetsp:Transcript_16366/g.40778  ORF Transcript_16366/g.40778 Transcript_16366/m.40778 type:complete len:345 (+) Transcript_16366:272-1306(+)
MQSQPGKTQRPPSHQHRLTQPLLLLASAQALAQPQGSGSMLAMPAPPRRLQAGGGGRGGAQRVHNGVRQVLRARRVEARHGDSAVHGQVDVVLVGQQLALRAREARVREHADLARDERPVAGRAARLQRAPQRRAHLLDAARHAAQLILPLLKQRGAAQHARRDLRAVAGRVGVHGADDQLELTLHARRHRLARAHHAQRAHALAVQAHVLGKRLRQQHLLARHGSAHADGRCIRLQVTTGKALVGGVEEGQQLALRAHAQDAAPLLRGGVHASGVVRASVQHDHRAWLGVANVGHEPLVVEAACGGLEVAVLLDRHAGAREDGAVGGPRGVGDEHRLYGVVRG